MRVDIRYNNNNYNLEKKPFAKKKCVKNKILPVKYS